MDQPEEKKERRLKITLLGGTLGLLVLIVTVVGIWRINAAQGEVEMLREDLAALTGASESSEGDATQELEEIQAELEELRNEESALNAEVEDIEVEIQAIESHFPIDPTQLKFVRPATGPMSLPMTLRDGTDGCTLTNCEEQMQVFELVGDLTASTSGIHIDLDFCGISLDLSRTDSGDYDGTGPLTECEFVCDDLTMSSTVSMYLIPHTVDLVEPGNGLGVTAYSGFLTQSTAPAHGCRSALVSHEGLWTVGP